MSPQLQAAPCPYPEAMSSQQKGSPLPLPQGREPSAAGNPLPLPRGHEPSAERQPPPLPRGQEPSAAGLGWATPATSGAPLGPGKPAVDSSLFRSFMESLTFTSNFTTKRERVVFLRNLVLPVFPCLSDPQASFRSDLTQTLSALPGQGLGGLGLPSVKLILVLISPSPR